MKTFEKSINDIFKELNVNKNKGLSSDQVIKNRNVYGENFFIKKKKKTLHAIIFEICKDPLIVLLFIAFFITLIINFFDYFQKNKINFIESTGIFIAIFISVLITSVLEYKSLKTFYKLNKIVKNIKVKTIRNGKISFIYSNEIVVGDIIELNAGEKIPADGRIIESFDLIVDESTLTGESKFVNKKSNIVLKKEKNLTDRINMLFASCFIISGKVKMIVTKTGEKTEFGLILKELTKDIKNFTPMQIKLLNLAKIITIVGTIISFFIFAIQIILSLLNNNLNIVLIGKIFINSIVFIVAVIPEGLSTTITIVLAINIIKMYKENALIKKLFSCETLGSVNVICSDKTGTLTKNKMTINKIYNNGNLFASNNINIIKNKNIIYNMILNNNADFIFENNIYKSIGSPTECCMLNLFCKNLNKINLYKNIYKKFKIQHRYLFSSENKNMTTIIKNLNIFTSFSKGSPEKILSQCNNILSDNKIIFLSKLKLIKITKLINKYQEKGKRVIAFSYKNFTKQSNFKSNRKFFETNMVFDGFIVIEDPLKNNICKAINFCKKANIDIKILTGDNIITAKAIGEKLKLINKKSIILEGKDIDNLEDEELKTKIKDIKIIARSTPFIKLRIVKILKSLGNIVAVTGDGINDSLAIKNADIGISMGISGSEISKEASDIVLLDDNFYTIVKAIKWGRNIYENFQRFIQFQLTVNFSASIVILSSLALGLSMPFTALQILWINLIMDGPPAITLGIEPIRNSIINSKPIKKNSQIITKYMFNNIFINGIIISCFCIFQILFNIIGCKTEEQSTVLFALFVSIHLFNIFNAKELNDSSIFLYLFKNKIMIIIFILTFIFQILIVQLGKTFFNTVPLNFFIWIKIIFYSIFIIIISELIKFIKRQLLNN